MNNHRRCDMRTMQECNCHPGQCIQDTLPPAPRPRHIVMQPEPFDVLITASFIALLLASVAFMFSANEKAAFDRCLKTRSFDTCQSTMNP